MAQMIQDSRASQHRDRNGSVGQFSEIIIDRDISLESYSQTGLRSVVEN